MSILRSVTEKESCFSSRSGGGGGGGGGGFEDRCCRDKQKKM